MPAKSVSSNKKKSKTQEKLALRSIAYFISKGYSIENAANKADIPVNSALELTALPAFEDELGKISPSALEAWRESQQEDSISIHVKQQAKKDGMSFYKQMKDDIGALDPKERIPLLEKLLRLGGYFDKEEVREVVTLAPSTVNAIREAQKEMDQDPKDIRNPYDA